jgi:hypothetical protein
MIDQLIAWFHRFVQLPQSELRHRGMIAIGVGVCCFAALLTLKIFAPVPLWVALFFASAAVASITLGAVLLERAAL